MLPQQCVELRFECSQCDEAAVANVVKAGMMYRKMGATPTEKLAIDSMTVDSDSSTLKLHFRTDDNRFQSLLHSDLFAAVSR